MLSTCHHSEITLLKHGDCLRCETCIGPHMCLPFNIAMLNSCSNKQWFVIACTPASERGFNLLQIEHSDLWSLNSRGGHCLVTATTVELSTACYKSERCRNIIYHIWKQLKVRVAVYDSGRLGGPVVSRSFKIHIHFVWGHCPDFYNGNLRLDSRVSLVAPAWTRAQYSCSVSVSTVCQRHRCQTNSTVTALPGLVL